MSELPHQLPNITGFTNVNVRVYMASCNKYIDELMKECAINRKAISYFYGLNLIDKILFHINFFKSIEVLKLDSEFDKIQEEISRTKKTLLSLSYITNDIQVDLDTFAFIMQYNPHITKEWPIAYSY